MLKQQYLKYASWLAKYRFHPSGPVFADREWA